MGITKKQLAIILSKLTVFKKPKVKLEQYPTDSNIAADIVWNMIILGDSFKKKISDLGAGTGILSIGTLFGGASKVIGYEIDDDALMIANENYQNILEKFEFEGDIEFIKKDILKITETTDVVIQNPPFGTREKHADLIFLTKALEISSTVYSLHKTSTIDYITNFINKKGSKVSHRWDYRFPLKKTLEQHKQKIQKIEVSCLRIIKKS